MSAAGTSAGEPGWPRGAAATDADVRRATATETILPRRVWSTTATVGSHAPGGWSPAAPAELPSLSAGWFRRSVLFACLLAGVFLVLGLVASWRLLGGAALPERAGWLLPAMLLFGASSYFLRFVRWHVLVRRLAPRLGLAPSLRIYAAGFAMGLTPGRVGEFCKFALLRDETGVPEAQSAPIFPLERLTEAASFTALAVAGAVLGHLTLGNLGVGAIAAIVAVPALAVFGVLLRTARKRALPLPLGEGWGEGSLDHSEPSPGLRPHSPIGRGLISHLFDGVSSIVEVRSLGLAMLCALAARACDAGLFWCAATAAGLALPITTAALAWGLAGLAGGIFLLPGGVGAVEGSLVATAAAFGADPAAALAAALLARCLSLWAWIPGGLYFAARGAARA